MAKVNDKTHWWQELHGRSVRIFHFINQPDGVCPYVEVVDGQELILHYETMGDRAEVWIVRLDSTGRELGRYNVKALENIMWAEAV